jgi:hypothetical protein
MCKKCLLLIFFSIVRLQKNCGVHFLVVWYCLGNAWKGEPVVDKLEGIVGKL